MNKSKMYDSHARVKENVSYTLRDKDGNLKQLWQENALARFLMKHNLLSPFKVEGNFLFGHYAFEKNVSNLITNVGRGLISGLINGSGAPAAATYIAVGTSVTAAAVTDTTLGTETSTSGLARAAGTVSLVTTTITNDTAQITKTFSVTGTVAVTESGVLNASSAGTLLCHQVFSAINVANGDSLQVTWKIQNA